MNPRLRTALIWLGLLCVVVALAFLSDRGPRQPERTGQQFVQDVQAEQVASVVWSDEGIDVVLLDGTAYRAPLVTEPNLWSELARQGVQIEYEEAGLFGFFGPLGGLLGLTLVILGLLAVVVWWGRRQQAKGLMGVQEFRKSKARLLQPGSERTRFSDVGGAVEAKQALGDVVDWIKHPKRWEEAGVRAPRGVLLEGPPGNGKTLLARAVAGEAGVRFFVSSATEFVELFVGVGPARVRDLFETAQKHAPCVIFIDELDAIGRRRGAGVGLNNDEREQTLNQLLVQLDGFERGGRFVVIGATNRADVLDPALLRAGRFDVRVRVGEPTAEEREEVLRIHARNRPSGELDYAALARVTEGWTGASLERLVNEASLRAMRRSGQGKGQTGMGMSDFGDCFAAEIARSRHYDPLDTVLIDSTSQLAEPVGLARAEFRLVGGETLVGRVVWANPEMVKVEPLGAAEGRLIARAQIASVRAIPQEGLSQETGP